MTAEGKALYLAVREAARRVAVDPVARAKAQAVTKESPLMERLAASLLGFYMPLTGNEVRELDAALQAMAGRGDIADREAARKLGEALG